MVEFTVAGIPCIGLNGGPAFKHNEAFSFQIATDDQHETDRYWNAIVGKWRAGKRVRLVQRQVGRFLANHAARADSLSVFNWCRLRNPFRSASIRGANADAGCKPRNPITGIAGYCARAASGHAATAAPPSSVRNSRRRIIRSPRRRARAASAAGRGRALLRF
jgi:3-demethylubiquinone-9 3-methyltransferase